jgi:transcriptional regulator with XRE-family HTH domain
MQKTVHSEAVRFALAAKGWNQTQLAKALNVSGHAVTNWMEGVDFPRPATLLKLATTLAMSFEELVRPDTTDQPVIAFRKNGAAKTADERVRRARAMGAMLKLLAAHLPARQSLHTQISGTSLAYDSLQASVAAVRAKLGIGPEAVLPYERLIGQFAENDAVIVPVMWGARGTHENALHIRLPAEKVTFVYLNLDTPLEDFKFWMARELAHVFTPELVGKDEGEDFADAFAGALLFPKELAHRAYVSASHRRTPSSAISALRDFAREHMVSLYVVFDEISKYTRARGLPTLKVTPRQVHAARNSDNVRGELVSATLFRPLPPKPAVYISAAHTVFKSAFFTALQALLRERGTGVGYVQQVMSVPLADAQVICDKAVS